MESAANKDKLLERILSDARADADAAREQADEAIRKIETERDERIAALKADHAKKRDALVTGIIDGYRTRATLSIRKEDLKSRRELVERVFMLTHEQILKLDEQKRGKLYLRLLETETQSGDTIVPSAADRAVIGRVLPKELILSDENAPIEGGFRIIGKGYEKDCSTEAIMAQLRMDEETQAAKKLFE